MFSEVKVIMHVLLLTFHIHYRWNLVTLVKIFPIYLFAGDVVIGTFPIEPT